MPSGGLGLGVEGEVLKCCSWKVPAQKKKEKDLLAELRNQLRKPSPYGRGLPWSLAKLETGLLLLLSRSTQTKLSLLLVFFDFPCREARSAAAHSAQLKIARKGICGEKEKKRREVGWFLGS
jgi:hypothetical protein